MTERNYDKNYLAMQRWPKHNMKKTAQATTQQFTEIQDIRDSIVLLTGGNACLVMQITAVNFALLAPEEQDAKVAAYAALLNSLSFPIQIIVQSKQVQIAPYINTLTQAAQATQNEKLATSINLYKTFVENLVKTATVLDKQFFIAIPFTAMEGGIKAATAASNMNDFFIQAKASLETKADSLIAQLDRLSLRAKILEEQELVTLFYSLFNADQPLHPLDIQAMIAQVGGTR